MSPSRRSFLRLAAGATAALAGCNGVGDPAVDRPSPPPHEPVRPLVVVHARSGSSDPLFTLAEDDAGGSFHLTDRSRASELDFADSDAAARLETAVRDTDFERHSLYLHQHEVGECYRVHLTEVSRRDDSVHASFCQELRGASVECSRDRQVRVGHAIRLPFAGDDFSGIGRGFSSHCGPGAADAVRTRTGGDG